MPQQNLSDFVDDMEKAGMLVRITEEKRVDELPAVMEANPLTAVLVENVKDCEFQFLANAYSNQDQTAWALGCDKSRSGLVMSELAKGRVKPEIVDTAPCKEVVLIGDEVDLTRLPLFLHHDRDGHAFTNDNLVISKHPDTGVYDWGIYRSMFRSKNEKMFDMTCTSHRQRLNAIAAQDKGENLEVAIVIGGPIVDKIASLTGVPPDTDDFEVLGSFYGHPAKLVKCETIDVLVPANAEIVLECELMASEGLTHDEGPYGEFTGMYGGGIKKNYRAVVKAMTYRKGGIYQHATIGGTHPWYTDNMLQLPALEADIFGALKFAGIDVKEVRCDLGGLSNIAYAKIKPNGAGDGKQALGIMLTCSKLALPKIAMVFDEDIDIWDDNAVKFAMAFRFMPHLDTIIIPGCNTMTVDPMIGSDVAPGTASKMGMDCTIPMGPQFSREHFDRSTVFVLGDPPPDVVAMTEVELTSDMEALIGEAPRTWKEILQHYNGQPYPVIYRAFSNLRPRLGRCDDAPWYRYTFSDSDFAAEVPDPKLSNFDPRHRI
ncbi:UbiD family decarboxylase [Mycolicibacterium wolinskyi]|uniref:Carboxylyase n=1 Tax=Mycolicibacterium wolinskyi TaxID=59750 RepID=A0A1X2FDD0_9MYCO|nr:MULTISPECIES: UbiD family decarboxylase [Mycolicibacterium]MCV7289238.1 UbiD family decarboxylase [Mycolicibacterium wolinskyi]MCV7294265.1 UbiD family decarboxylase [Mycolicibacterium goodii]ORX16452.1 carboxylyase [Mycolicibacterium wolinskyi]